VFVEAEDGGCIIDFYVDFEFRSRILQNLIGLLFNEAVQRMVTAFEKRAHAIYGNGAKAGAAAAPAR
jgi:coenzyme Q-binding protein COQ10